ncbi:hypothetical protein ACQP3J_32590, partial [Escherichia coli]
IHKYKIATCSVCIILLICIQGSEIIVEDGAGVVQSKSTENLSEIVSLRKTRSYIHRIMAMPAST